MENREIELRTADLFALLLKSAKFILIATLIITLLGSAFGVCRVLFFMPSVTEEDVQDAETSLKLAEKTLDEAAQIAADFTARSIELSDRDREERYGVRFEAALPRLMKDLNII